MIRFATVGSNFITDLFIEASKLCPAFRLQAVYSRSESRAKELAAQWGAPLAFASLEQLAACPDIDAVYIASPNSSHATQVELLLKNGKHVLCEKPLASSLDVFCRLQALAKQRNLVLLEAMRPAHMPAVQSIRRATSRIGTLRRAVLSYCQYSSRYGSFKSGVMENAFDPTLHNGALLDIGVYCVALMVMLLGSPTETTAKGWFLPSSIDAAGSIMAEYPGGLQALLSYSKVNTSHLPNEIQGEEGCIQFSPLSVPAQAKIIWNDGTTEPIHIEPEAHDMRFEINDFIRIIENNEPYDLFSTITKETLAILDTSRRQIGIEFVKVVL